MAKISRTRSLLYLLFLPLIVLAELIKSLPAGLVVVGKAYASGYRGFVYGDDEHGWKSRKARRYARLAPNYPLKPCPTCYKTKGYAFDTPGPAQLCENQGCYVDKDW